MSALAATLLHFLWQGAFVALLLAGVNRVLSRADSRYAAACGALAAMLALSTATYVVLARQTPSTAAHTAPSAAAPSAQPDASASLSDRLTPALPRMPLNAQRAIVLFWLAGVAALSLRLAGGWAAAVRLSRRGVEPPPEPWRERLEVLSARLKVARPVRLLASVYAGVPSALGVLRPVILVPAGAFTALSAPELEAILAHELAHVRRNDFFVNLVQSAAETLLFYHPAVWWVSHRIRIERENACDDLAVTATGDAALYARALVGLEEGRTALPRLAVAATGGSLLERVRRLVTPPAARPDRLPPSIAAVLALVAVAFLGAAARVAQPVGEPRVPRLPAPAPVSAPAPASAVETPAPPPVPEAPPPVSLAAAATRRPAAQPPAPRPATPPPAAAPSPEAPAKAAPRAPRLSPNQLIDFRIHGVTPEFVEELQALGFSRLSADDLVSMRIHGVTPEFIRAMRSAGVDEDVEQYTAFRIHGVTPEFVREMDALGLKRLSAETLTAFRIHGVTPEFVRGIQALGYTRVSPEELTSMRIHGVTADTIRALNKRYGEKVSVDELIDAHIHGLKGDNR